MQVMQQTWELNPSCWMESQMPLLHLGSKQVVFRMFDMYVWVIFVPCISYSFADVYCVCVCVCVWVGGCLWVWVWVCVYVVWVWVVCVCVHVHARVCV